MSYHPLDLDRDLRTQRRDIRHAQRTQTDLNRLWRRERRRMFRRCGHRMPNVVERRPRSGWWPTTVTYLSAEFIDYPTIASDDRTDALQFEFVGTSATRT